MRPPALLAGITCCLVVLGLPLAVAEDTSTACAHAQRPPHCAEASASADAQNQGASAAAAAYCVDFITRPPYVIVYEC